MKIIIDSQDKISSMAASMIAEHAKAKPGCAMAFAAGRTTKKVYDALTAMNIKELAECKAFTENRERLRRIFAADKFDAEIEECGGIELAVLGIGTNGHIGFNEPATPYDSYTHTVLLTDKTKQMNAELFGGLENVPDNAVTMGLKTICESKNVILVAFGSEKAEIIHQLVYGKTSTYVPAAMLQMHMNMTLLLDDAAAEKIK